MIPTTLALQTWSACTSLHRVAGGCRPRPSHTSRVPGARCTHHATVRTLNWNGLAGGAESCWPQRGSRGHCAQGADVVESDVPGRSPALATGSICRGPEARMRGRCGQTSGAREGCWWRSCQSYICLSCWGWTVRRHTSCTRWYNPAVWPIDHQCVLRCVVVCVCVYVWQHDSK